MCVPFTGSTFAISSGVVGGGPTPRTSRWSSAGAPRRERETWVSYFGGSEQLESGVTTLREAMREYRRNMW